jgi:hypothetical protein
MKDEDIKIYFALIIEIINNQNHALEQYISIDTELKQYIYSNNHGDYVQLKNNIVDNINKKRKTINNILNFNYTTYLTINKFPTQTNVRNIIRV